ncbi:hypothetical protein AAVH_17823 [Aphelenchoides avenae]|nr:hypothetical protein AAVH_17823 [Aphelenchus avenae]
MRGVSSPPLEREPAADIAVGEGPVRHKGAAGERRYCTTTNRLSMRIWTLAVRLMYDLDDDYGPANEEDGEIVSYHSLMFGRRFTFRLSRASEKMTGLREYYCVACRDIDEKYRSRSRNFKQFECEMLYM